MIERATRRCVLSVILMLAAGCTSFEVFNSTGLRDLAKSDNSKIVTFHGSYWGSPWSDTDHIPCGKIGGDECKGLHTVAISSNLFYDIAPILTLGLWVPATVEVWCYHQVTDDPNTNTTLPPESGGTPRRR